MEARIVVHDYSGHAFPVQLSRELARRGHTVLHLHCPSYSTGKGALSRTPDDPDTFEVRPINLGEQFNKYSLWKRPVQECAYARRLIPVVEAFSPQILISSNTPLLSQRMLLSACRKVGIPFVFWQQDIYSLPMERMLKRRIPIIGRRFGQAIVALEGSLLRKSNAVVTISQDFLPKLAEWGVASEQTHVVENWAPLEEVPAVPRDNHWARTHDLVGKRVLLYAGTLGFKHNPNLLLRLADHFAAADDVRLIVISEGDAAQAVAREARTRRLANVAVLDFQPYETLPDVLASADVLTVILEQDAGRYSVPSKVLTYLCAGRPILGALPSENAAARIIRENQCGLVVDPADPAGFVAAAEYLMSDVELRRQFGDNARAYAERAFDIGAIGDRFEEILGSLRTSLPD